MGSTDINPQPTPTGDELVVDGRTARRNRNKVAVLDALIELAADGDDEPSIEAIADLAGVSYRSVYRYFDDRTDLMMSAIGRLTEDVRPLLEIRGADEGSLEERINKLVDARIVVYRKLSPLARIAVRRRIHEPVVAEYYEKVRDAFRARLVALFDNELAAVPSAELPLTIAAIEVMFQFEALDFLAGRDELTDDDLARLLTRHVYCLLGPDAASMRSA